jgi:hypothetical protein
VGRRPGAGWSSLAHGVHVRAEMADDLATGLLARQLVLPFWSSFTGPTAAQLRGWWLPPLPSGLPLFVASGRSDRIDRPGLRVCRHDVLQTWVMVDNIRTSMPAETVLACARELGLLDVVLIGDGALHSADVTREQLVEVSRLRRRGSPLLRRALPLMDGRSESIYETLLRILHVVCEVRVEPQRAVTDSEGEVIARGDLWLTGTRMLHEYDGGDHLTPARQRRDLRRQRRLILAGFERRGYTAVDVLHAPAGILRDADSSIGREHDPARLQPWYALLRDSLFTASGRHRLQQRLGLADEENAEESRA